MTASHWLLTPGSALAILVSTRSFYTVTTQAMVYAGHCSQQDSASAGDSLRVHRFSFPQHNTKTNKRAIQTHRLKYAWAVCCRHQVTQLESWQVRGHWVTETWQEGKQLGLLQLYFALHVALSFFFLPSCTLLWFATAEKACGFCFGINGSIKSSHVPSTPYCFKISLWWGHAASQCP